MMKNDVFVKERNPSLVAPNGWTKQVPFSYVPFSFFVCKYLS
jgi:hypothetical protein